MFMYGVDGDRKCVKNVQLLMFANIDFICFWNQLGEKIVTQIKTYNVKM